MKKISILLATIAFIAGGIFVSCEKKAPPPPKPKKPPMEQPKPPSKPSGPCRQY